MARVSQRLSSAIALAGLAIAVPAHAQDATPAPRTDYYGIKLGANATTLSGDGALDPSIHLSVGIGAFYTREIIPRLRIAPELLMTEKGADFEDPTGDPADEGLLYLQLTVLGRYDLPIAARVTLFGFAGPAAGYVIDSKRAPKSELTRFDVSAMTGVGVDIDPGSHRILVDVRGEIGFLNQLDREDGKSAKNRGLSLFVGVSI